MCVKPPLTVNLLTQLTRFSWPVKSFTTYEDAMAFAAGQDVPSKSDEAPRYYAVAIGRTPGVYTSWPQAQEAVIGWKGPKYKRFNTRAEAEAFVRTFGNANANTNSNSNSTIAPLEISSDESEDEVQEVAPPPAKKTKVTGVTGGITVIYTDGSSLGNGKAGAAAGVGVYFGENDPRCVQGVVENYMCRTSANESFYSKQKYLRTSQGRAPNEPKSRAHGDSPVPPGHW